MTSSDNPCSTCSVGQDCCTRLSGLRVTEEEYLRCFASHADRLRVERDGPIYMLTALAGPCPNWQAGGCGVYDQRPRECRLFPFTLFVRPPQAGTISIGFHCDTLCPQKARLLPSEPEVVQLITDFAREAFPERPVEIRRETWWERWKRRVLRWVRP